MYDELIKRLRVFCKGCKLWDGCKCCLKGECSQQKSLQAADAIEELKKDLERGQDYYEFWKHKAEQGLKMLQVAISNMPCWIPVTERLPEKDDDVLMYAEWTGVSGTIYKDISLSTISELKNMGYRVTHWMPLPKPPESEGET